MWSRMAEAAAAGSSRSLRRGPTQKDQFGRHHSAFSPSVRRLRKYHRGMPNRCKPNHAASVQYMDTTSLPWLATARLPVATAPLPALWDTARPTWGKRGDGKKETRCKANASR